MKHTGVTKIYTISHEVLDLKPYKTTDVIRSNSFYTQDSLLHKIFVVNVVQLTITINQIDIRINCPVDDFLRKTLQFDFLT